MNSIYDYVRKADLGHLRAIAKSGEVAMQTLLGHDSGARNCLINVIVVPPDRGSPVGWHTHECEQVFFIVAGVMTFEIDGQRFLAGKDSIIIAPTGMPHRNWNEGAEDVYLISFNAPLPDPNRPLAIPVE